MNQYLARIGLRCSLARADVSLGPMRLLPRNTLRAGLFGLAGDGFVVALSQGAAITRLGLEGIGAFAGGVWFVN